MAVSPASFPSRPPIVVGPIRSTIKSRVLLLTPLRRDVTGANLKDDQTVVFVVRGHTRDPVRCGGVWHHAHHCEMTIREVSNASRPGDRGRPGKSRGAGRSPFDVPVLCYVHPGALFYFFLAPNFGVSVLVSFYSSISLVPMSGTHSGFIAAAVNAV